MAYYSNKYVRPALYEKVLKHKIVQEQQSSRSIDKILDGGLYEFANIYAGAWGDQQSPAHLLRQCLKSNNDYYTEYKGKKTFYESMLRKLLNNFSTDDAVTTPAAE